MRYLGISIIIVLSFMAFEKKTVDLRTEERFGEIIARREHSSRRIRIWSAGCATGEEPYSIAIALRELIPNLESWNVMILATDINRDALRKAREGLYGAWSFRGVEKRIQDRYFRLNGKNDSPLLATSNVRSLSIT